MPKCLIAYFSQGGTTARVAERIAAGLGNAGYGVDLCGIKDVSSHPKPLEGYDLLGIGLPAYVFRPPFNVSDYVNSLPDLSGLSVFVFLLFGSIPGDAGNLIRHILVRKGAKEVGYFRCRGADYYFGYLREGYLFSPDSPTAEELAQAENFGQKLALTLAGKEAVRIQDDPGIGLMYRFERLATCRPFVRFMYSWMFFVKKKKCSSCGVCMKVCPVGNIKADKNGRPVWGNKCILCCYCDLKCPQEAIVSPAKLLPLFRLCHLYNIRQMLKNPAISCLRVTLKSGRAEKINIG